MLEDDKVKDKEVVVITAPKEQETDPPEEKALTLGWVPEEDFQGEEGTWVDAETFIKQAPLFKKIGQQKRKIKRLQESQNHMVKHHNEYKEAAKSAYETELASLKSMLKEAVESGDSESATTITDKIVETSAAANKVDSTVDATKNSLQEHHEEWVEENNWYNSDKEMTEYANTIAYALLMKNSTPEGDLEIPVEDLYTQIDENLQAHFPKKFGKGSMTTTTAVTTKSNSSGKSSLSADRKKLTPAMKKVMESLVRQKTMTEEEYIKDLKESGQL